MKKQPFFIIPLMIIGLLNCTLTEAQKLDRKASLGAYLSVIDADFQTRVQPPQNEGVFILKVIDGGTADKLGIQADDILLSINDLPCENIPQIIEQVSDQRAGTDIRIEVIRRGKPMKIEGKMSGKPMETYENAVVEYGAVPFQKGHLRSILYTPKADGNFPLVVYFQGYGCGSIDKYYNPGAPIRQLVNGLVDAGFAVYRVESPGIGDCDNTPDCGDISYQDQLDAFSAALDKLKEYKFIDQENIFYFGHSLGGISAPLLAVKHQPKGVIVYGTVVKSWYEYLLDVNREQAMVRGDDFVQMEQSSRAIQPFLADLFLFKKTPEELAKNPAYAEFLNGGLFGKSGDRLGPHHYRFLQELNDQNLTEAWQKTNAHTLALYGEFDLHAISPESAKVIADIVNAYHPGKGSFCMIPQTEHAMVSVPDMASYVAMRRNGTFNDSYMAENFNPEVVRIITDWMLELLIES
ncbi:MAG: hypothetical protein DHS20C18_13550 [Saprospiraceae bacterium]|nr:MAG: hypothetical protein DHS20C18_13550 [Saprospiraceae bacterium]